MFLQSVNLVVICTIATILSSSWIISINGRATSRPYSNIYSAYGIGNPTKTNSNTDKNSLADASPSQRCSKGGKTRIEDLTNPTKFYMCTYNSAHHVWMVYSFNCPAETQFDKNSQKCSTKFITPTKSHSTKSTASTSNPSQSNPNQNKIKPGASPSQLQYMKNLLAQKTNVKPSNDVRRTTVSSLYNRVRPAPNSHQYVRFSQRPTIPTRSPYYKYTKAPSSTTTTTTTTTSTTTTERSTTPIEKLVVVDSTDVEDADDEPNNIGVIRTIASRIAYLAQAIQTILTSFDTTANFCDDENVIVKIGSDEDLDEDGQGLEDKIQLNLPASTPPSFGVYPSSHFNYLDHYNRIRNGTVNTEGQVNLATSIPTVTQNVHLTTPPPSILSSAQETEETVEETDEEKVQTQTQSVDNVNESQLGEKGAEWNIFLNNLNRFSGVTHQSPAQSTQIKEPSKDVPVDGSELGDGENGTVLGGDGAPLENSQEQDKIPRPKLPSSSATLSHLQKIKELADSLKIRGNNRKPRSLL